ncbi:MAG: YqeG family HAD IIIA-type phosphatase [Elainellaceae cyanobacterium]
MGIPSATSSHSRPHKRFQIRLHRVANIDIAQLKHKGISGIILDLDNTIVSEDDQYVSPFAEDWIKTAQKEGLKLFLLSNGKRKHRADYWSRRLQMPAISPAHKPRPKSFRLALRHMELHPHEVVVVGDSFHTDVCGAWMIGSSSIQICSLPHPPRWWEALVGRWLQQRDPDPDSLWRFEA